MSEQNHEFDEKRTKMLYRVLLEEYEHLGIFDKTDVKEIEDSRTENKKILPFLEAEKLPPKQRQEQFELRQNRRFELLEKIRRKIHFANARRFNETYVRYKKFFADKIKDFDEKILEVAANLATLKELKEGIKTESKKNALEIYNQADILVKGDKNKQPDLADLEAELDSIKQNETANSLTALCFSGGGIRSATFGLGVLQSLAKRGLLGKFTYLSTVSGGGYIGSWLSAWIHRQGLKKVEDDLISEDLETGEVEAPEITHLRSYSNYMSPTLGLFSADTWTLIAVYLRNLLLNWTVIIPLLAAFLLLPKLFVSFLNLNYAGEYQFLIWVFSAWAGVVAISNTNQMRPSLKAYSGVDQRYKQDDIGTWKSVEGKIFRWIILWTFFLAIGMTIFWYWNQGKTHLPTTNWLAGFIQTDERQTLQLLDFIQFAMMLFLCGYFLSWLLMLRKFWNNSPSPPANESHWAKIRRIFKTYVSEPLALTFCGIVGGSILYLVVEKILPLLLPLFPPGDFVNWYAVFGVPLFLGVFLLTTTVFTGMVVKITDDDDREWIARFGAWILIIIVGWTVISSAVIFGPQLIDYVINKADWIGKTVFAAIGGISGIVSLVLGFSSQTPANDKEDSGGVMASIIKLGPTLGAPIFLLFLLCLLSYLTTLLTNQVKILPTFNQTAWFVILAVIGFGMGFFININKFSFHSTYRERLIRAYLGASRTKDRLKNANSFTGLDTDNDNLEMKVLKGQKPFPVINMTLNLVKPNNLKWQARKAESFTVTPLHCGSSNMGAGSGNYRSSDWYGFNKQTKKAITLGTAAAISGAAASPNMGYFSMGTAVAFLMVLLNVRLGWWLGNPGKRGNQTFQRSTPLWSPKTFFIEALGLTDDQSRYVYLSDGGHFENLGLYEMVLRRCQTIIVCDGGSDPTFSFFDLGSAVHKIRVDMGIPIKFESNPTMGRNCSIATINYQAVDGTNAQNGTLIYLKPTLDANQPIDIVQYQSVNKAFPHEGTLDQFYSETQFECYRKLGFNMMESICKGDLDDATPSIQEPVNSIAELISRAKGYLKKVENKEKEKLKESKPKETKAEEE
jgi:hypothetical protein